MHKPGGAQVLLTAEPADEAVALNVDEAAAGVIIQEGLAFRGTEQTGQGGLTVFKGENISSCLIEGPPAHTDILPELADSPSIWRDRATLPVSAVAVASQVNGLCAVMIDPSDVAVMNSALLLVPKPELALFPFDILFRSTLYQWYLAFFEWSGTLLNHRTHVYAGTIARLPWTDALLASADRLHEVRTRFLDAHRAAAARTAAVDESLVGIPTETFQERFDRDKTLRVRYSSAVDAEPLPDGYKIYYGNDMFAFVEVNDATLGRMLERNVHARNAAVSEKEIMTLRVAMPGSEAVYFKTLEALRHDERRTALQELDEVVFDAFGLTGDERALILADTEQDLTLRALDPRPPYTSRKFKGVRKSLMDSQRYEKVRARATPTPRLLSPVAAAKATPKRRGRQADLFEGDPPPSV